jgi:hypothetical protein
MTNNRFGSPPKRAERACVQAKASACGVPIFAYNVGETGAQNGTAAARM